MIDAFYFDGQSTRRLPVTLIIHKRIIAVRGEGLRLSVRLSQVNISERLAHAPRIVRLKDGGIIEIANAGFDKMLKANRYREPRVVYWQQNWPLSLCALVLLVTLLISGYQWGLPWAADRIAQHLPSVLAKKIGDQGLALVDRHYMKPSRLDLVDQARLQRLFSEMKQPRDDKTAYRLEFRHSPMGPNAFALPNGVIIMTDELVKLAANDQAVLGVLGHELGHVRHHHSMRNILQTLGVGVVIHVLVGDVSSALAAAPTLLLDQKYSRDFEREADRYAIDMMLANRMPLSPMADLFEKMGDPRAVAAALRTPEDTRNRSDTAQAENDDADEPAPNGNRTSRKRGASAMDYLSSHPSSDERIDNLRAADRRQ